VSLSPGSGLRVVATDCSDECELFRDIHSGFDEFSFAFALGRIEQLTNEEELRKCKEDLASTLSRLILPIDFQRRLWQLYETEYVHSVLTLRLHDRSLLGLPWELIPVRSPDGSETPIALHAFVHCCLAEPGCKRQELQQSDAPIRCLIAWADPSTLTHGRLAFLDAEIQAVSSTLRQAGGQSTVEIVPHATPLQLQRAIQRIKPHVMYLACHGEDRPSGGVLILEGDRSGQFSEVHSEEIAEWRGLDELTLCVLSVCESGLADGPAYALCRSGVSAVVAMTGSWGDDAGPIFARNLVGSIVEGNSIVNALTQGSRSIKGMGDGWSTPRLLCNASLEKLPAPTFGRVERIDEESQPVSKFIGRAQDILALEAIALEPATMVVTVSGMGGIGKTSLARRVADRSGLFGLACEWINCESITSKEELVQSVSERLERARSSLDRSGEKSKDRILVILDCFEGLLGDRHEIWSYLKTERESTEETAQAVFLITSREAIGAAGEIEYPLKPLPTAPGSGKLSEAATLFSVAAGFSEIDLLSPNVTGLIESVCQRLDGIPLALILAASQLGTLSLDDLEVELTKRRLPVLQARKPTQSRHDTLQKVILECYSALSEAERFLLWHLTVFSGSFTYDALADVADIDHAQLIAGFGKLCDGSFVVREESDGRARYKVLDTIREFVEGVVYDDRMAESKGEWRKRHSLLYCRNASDIDALMRAGKWDEGSEQLKREASNIRAATATAVHFRMEEVIISLSKSLCRHYLESGLWQDFESLAEAAMISASATGKPEVIASILGLKGALASRKGDDEACNHFWLQRVTLCERNGDWLSVCDAFSDLSIQALEYSKLTLADRYCSRAAGLARDHADTSLLATTFAIKAQIASARGNEKLALKHAERGAALIRQIVDRDSSLYILASLARVHAKTGEFNRAELVYLEVLDTALEGERIMPLGNALIEIASLYAMAQDLSRAAACYAVARSIRGELPSRLQAKCRRAEREFHRIHPAALSGSGHAPIQQPWKQVLRALIDQPALR